MSIHRRNKFSIEVIKKLFNDEGYTLLSNTYTNPSSFLEYECPKGHKHKIRWNDWYYRKHRCPYCAGNGKIGIDEVKALFLEENYVVLSDDYKNSKSKIKYKCPNGHIHFIRLDHWRRGIRCPYCSGKIKKSIEEIRNSIESYGYELISKYYNNVYDKLLLKCPEGHEFCASYHNWQKGTRCPICNGGVRLDFDEVKASFLLNGYKLMTNEYINSEQILHLICPNGHDYYVNFNNWKHKGSRCTLCSGIGRSNQEQELCEFLSSFISDVKVNVKNLIPLYELDIVMSSVKVAIEYCGLYWHSELHGKDKKYHSNKLELCNSIGYRLITIFEDEYMFNKEIVLSRLKAILNIGNLRTIYARTCKVLVISTKQAREFCEQNHLQSYTGAKVKLGAFYNEELVAVMTFAKPSISKGGRNGSGWELSRFCSKINCRVVGIASKLFKHFYRTYQPNNVFSYADRRWSDGNLYEKIGFSLEHITRPNYWYIVNKKRLRRFVLRKNESDDPNLTEWENRIQQGYDRIWDCGNYKYVYK